MSVSSLIVFGVETEASAAHRHQKTSLANMHTTHHHHQIVSLSRFVLFLVLNRCMCLSVGLRTAVQVLSKSGRGSWGPWNGVTGSELLGVMLGTELRASAEHHFFSCILLSIPGSLSDSNLRVIHKMEAVGKALRLLAVDEREASCGLLSHRQCLIL